MCMNKQYSDEEREEINVVTKFAKMILEDKGMSFEEVAAQENVTVEYVAQMVEVLEDINSLLYNQVIAMQLGKMYLEEENMTLSQIAYRENVHESSVVKLIDLLSAVNPTVAHEVQQKMLKQEN